MTLLDEMFDRVRQMDPQQFEEVKTVVTEKTGSQPWVPNPGPQTEAYFSKADLLLYGGAGGGGKTDLELGLAFTQHVRSLILRPQFADLESITDRAKQMHGKDAGFRGGGRPRLQTDDDRLIVFGAASDISRASTYQGQPFDLYCFDEACTFHELVVQFIMGWERSAEMDLDAENKQRTRVVLASNPPLGAEGEWILRWFAPWLDPGSPTYPAAPGELRWYITNPDGESVEVDGPEPITIDGREFLPKSRTFIPAKLDDNPFLRDTAYRATQDAMPEPLRSAIRDGNFFAAREDDAFQVIPTDWVLQANNRWRELQHHPQRPDKHLAMSSLGCDVARGGRDNTVLAPRWGNWFGELTVVPGRDTPDGPTVAALCAGVLRDGAVVGVDAIGVGADAETSLKNAGLPYEAMVGSESAYGRTQDGNFGFQTRRSEMWWMLREALDPQNKLEICLPPDTALQADLTAPTYEVRQGKVARIYVESKADMSKRLGRSPDRGDAVVYALNAGGMNMSKAGTMRRNQGTLRAPMPTMTYDPLRYD